MLAKKYPEEAKGDGQGAAGVEVPQPCAYAMARIEPGTVLDGVYRIDRLLGQGGMGDVYEAFNLTLERKVAIKTIRNAYMSIDEFRERFRREAVAMAKVDHPNVVRVHHCEAKGIGPSYIVMEFVEGVTLSELLRRKKRLHYTRAAKICKQILLALGAIHRVGIIHRDLKPANIMLTDTPHGYRVRICDFGLGKMLEPDDTSGPTQLTETGIPLGTPNYMSPEQCRGGRLSESSDIYAVGIVLFEMLVGRPPFDAPSKHGIIMRHLNYAPPLERIGADVPKAMRDLLAKALTKEPKRRFPSALAMLRVLHDILRKPAPRKTRRLLVGALVATITLIIGMGGVIGYGLLRDPPPARAVASRVTATVPVREMSVKTALEGPELVPDVIETAPQALAPPERWPKAPSALLALAQTYGDAGDRDTSSAALRRFLRACERQKDRSCSFANRSFAKARLKRR